MPWSIFFGNSIIYSSSFSLILSVLTAVDGKAPIATVEEEDDDVPGEYSDVFTGYWVQLGPAS